jgi:hypothetical protein
LFFIFSRLRKALEIQLDEFGQTPKQLFKEAHPARFALSDEPSIGQAVIRNFLPETNRPFDEEDDLSLFSIVLAKLSGLW